MARSTKTCLQLGLLVAVGMGVTSCSSTEGAKIDPAESTSPAAESTSPAAESTSPAAESTSPAAEAASRRPSEARHHASIPHVKTSMVRADEPHLKNIKQLTFGGENAEAYFNAAGDQLIFQSTRGELKCDQIFRMTAEGDEHRQVSVPGGRTTCGYIQDDDSIVYASTHGHGPGCLPSPDHSQGYVWPLYPQMDIWRADADGNNARVLFQSDGYDAEATICHRDGRIIFTSTKNGDLDLYVMDRDGQNVTQLTDTPGYDGGAFFSPDCSKIVWRASRPQGEALTAYQALLKQHLVRPSQLEIFVANPDGTEVTQVTSNGAANFAPYMHPDNRRVLFVSNQADAGGRNFDIFLIDLKTRKEERITTHPTFDGFPMWTHDGKKLVFASNRHNDKRGDTNIFIADWIE